MRHILIAALAWLVMGVPAHAQNCAPMTVIEDRLTDLYGERRAESGLRSASSIIEVWRNDETGTWTILMVRPSGMGCLIASGEMWQDWTPAQAPTGEPM